MTKSININLSVTTESEASAVEIAEQLGRQAVGLGLAGHNASMSVSTWEEDEDGRFES